MTALLTLSGADLGYRGVEVLAGVEMEVAAGDFIAVVGGNGSGKSTLLRTLLGALPVRRGCREAAAGLRFGYVPQQVALDPLFPLSAGEVAEMGLWRGRSVTGRLGSADLDFARACLDQVGMAAHGNRRFGELSGGQKQRVLVARALVGRPSLLLLDEPMAGVDQAASDAIRVVLDRAHQGGTAVVIVTHHPLSLAGQATASFVVAEGRVERREPDELLTPQGLAEVLG